MVRDVDVDMCGLGNKAKELYTLNCVAVGPRQLAANATNNAARGCTRRVRRESRPDRRGAAVFRINGFVRVWEVMTV